MSPGIVNFKVGTVIQMPNESVLPQLECGVLVLTVKARLGAEQLKRLNEFVLPERSHGVGVASLTTNFEFLNLLDDVIHWSRLSRIPLLIAPWNSAMRYTAGECLLDGFEVARTAESGPIIHWRVDVVVWIIVGLKSHVPLDILGLNEKQFGPTEVTRVNVVSSRVPVMKLHEVSEVSVVGMFVGHEPTSSGVGHGHRWMD